MSLSVPSYAAPQFAQPINTYVWVVDIHVSFATAEGSGRVVANVHPDAASAAAYLPPVDQFGVALGQPLTSDAGPSTPGAAPAPGTPAFYDLASLDAAAFALQKADANLTPFGAIREALYDANRGLRALPRLAGATEVP